MDVGLEYRPPRHHATAAFPSITIRSSLKGYVNKVAIQEYDLDEYDHYRLYLTDTSDEDYVIGIEPTNNDRERKFGVYERTHEGYELHVESKLTALWGLTTDSLERGVTCELTDRGDGVLVADFTEKLNASDVDPDVYPCRYAIHDPDLECSSSPFDSRQGRNIHEGHVHGTTWNTENNNDDNDEDDGGDEGDLEAVEEAEDMTADELAGNDTEEDPDEVLTAIDGLMMDTDLDPIEISDTLLDCGDLEDVMFHFGITAPHARGLADELEILEDLEDDESPAFDQDELRETIEDALNA